MDNQQPTVGFTGTRRGMTDAQKASVDFILIGYREGRHGDCKGSDEDFHAIARSHGLRLVGHPPSDDRLRAWCEFDEIHEPKPYLDRDRDVVDGTDELLATPREDYEAHNGGTWYTVRYARSLGRFIQIVWPDGTVHSENDRRSLSQ